MKMETNFEKYLEDCTLCPRKCHVNRLAGEKGFCGCGAELSVARAGIHSWEEPCISGEEGSGTIFFAGCSLGCVFCQNSAIQKEEAGKKITVDRLVQIMFELKEKGVNNINLVTPDHFAPQIADALRTARTNGLGIPVLWNSSGYEDPSTIALLDGLVDIYMPDFKYGPSSKAQRWSGTDDYFTHASAALEAMYSQVGEPEFDERGIMRRGVLVRHLLLPGCVKESHSVVDYLLDTYGDHIWISLMSQYTPMKEMESDPLLGRRVTKREYERLINHALEKGLTNGFIQEGGAALESFIPEFDKEGV